MAGQNSSYVVPFVVCNAVSSKELNVTGGVKQNDKVSRLFKQQVKK